VNYRTPAGLKVFYAYAIILLGAVFSTICGGTRLVRHRGFGIQPVELVKLCLIIFLAKSFSAITRGTPAGSSRFSAPASRRRRVFSSSSSRIGSAFVAVRLGLAPARLRIRRSHLLHRAVCLVTAVLAWSFALKPFRRTASLQPWDPSVDASAGYTSRSPSPSAPGTGRGSIRFAEPAALLPERQTDFIRCGRRGTRLLGVCS
jgi:cell division protein FtsW (lipid II flippase)